jgi:hypothetical protein
VPVVLDIVEEVGELIVEEFLEANRKVAADGQDEIKMLVQEEI